MVQNLASVGRVRDPINSQFRAQLLDELRRRTNTQIGGDKGGLEVIPGVIVELVSAGASTAGSATCDASDSGRPTADSPPAGVSASGTVFPLSVGAGDTWAGLDPSRRALRRETPAVTAATTVTKTSMPRIIQIRVMGFTSADISRSIHKTTRADRLSDVEHR